MQVGASSALFDAPPKSLDLLSLGPWLPEDTEGVFLLLDQTSVASPPSSWRWAVEVRIEYPPSQMEPAQEPLPAPIKAAPSPRLPLLPTRPPPPSSSLPMFSGGRGVVRRAHLGPCLTLASVYTQCYYFDPQNKEHFIRNGAFLIGQLSCSVISLPSALRGSILTWELRLF